MRVNLKTSDTGKERLDWDHYDGVSDVDLMDGYLRIHYQKHAEKTGESIPMDRIDYFHMTEIDDSEN